MKRAQRSRKVSFVCFGLLLLWLAAKSVAFLLMSRSDPWLVGGQHEPQWAWAIGSGRLKLWIAEPGTFAPDERWTNSWYRGLDGEPIRWDFTLHRGSTGGVIVLALPLWAVAVVLGSAGVKLILLGQRDGNERLHLAA